MARDITYGPPPVDGAADVGSLRTLGTGATQAAAGNHGHGSDYAAAAHTHAQSDVADLPATLTGLAQADVTLATAVESKADAAATTAALAGKSNTGHGHAIADVTGLQAALDAAGGGTPSGSAGGDLGGSYPNPTVQRITRHQVAIALVEITDVSAALPRAPTVRITSCVGTEPVELTAATVLPAGTDGERLRLENFSGKSIVIPDGHGILFGFDVTLPSPAVLELEYSSDFGGWISPRSDAYRLQGRNVAETAPTDGQAILWNASAGVWEPGDVAGGGGVELQGSTPGTAQTGHAHVTGKVLAQAGVVAGAGTGGAGQVELTHDSDGSFLAGVNIRDGNGYTRTRIKDRRWQAWDQPGASGGTNTVDVSADETAPYVKVTAAGGANAALKPDGLWVNGVLQGFAVSPKTPALDANHTDSWLMTETSGTTFANQVGGRPALTAAQASDWAPRYCLFHTRTNPELTPATTPLRATGLALPGHTGSLTIEWFCRYTYGSGTWIATPFVFLTAANWGAGDADYMGCGNGFYVHSKIGGAARDFSPAASITDRLSTHHAMLVYTRSSGIAFWMDGVSLASQACGSFGAALDRIEVGGWSNVYPFDRNSVQISNIRISNVARDGAYAAQVQACLRAG